MMNGEEMGKTVKGTKCVKRTSKLICVCSEPV